MCVCKCIQNKLKCRNISVYLNVQTLAIRSSHTTKHAHLSPGFATARAENQQLLSRSWFYTPLSNERSQDSMRKQVVLELEQKMQVSNTRTTHCYTLILGELEQHCVVGKNICSGHRLDTGASAKCSQWSKQQGNIILEC